MCKNEDIPHILFLFFSFFLSLLGLSTGTLQNLQLCSRENQIVYAYMRYIPEITFLKYLFRLNAKLNLE